MCTLTVMGEKLNALLWCPKCYLLKCWFSVSMRLVFGLFMGGGVTNRTIQWTLKKITWLIWAIPYNVLVPHPFMNWCLQTLIIKSRGNSQMDYCLDSNMKFRMQTWDFLTGQSMCYDTQLTVNVCYVVIKSFN